MGEGAPHYVSFVIPVDDQRGFFPEYICETITAEDDEKRIASHRLVAQGEDSFLLRLGKREFWFNVRPGPKAERHGRYLGRLQHADFALLLTEIEPEDLDQLDMLYEEENTFVIGCEPFAHYSGIKIATKKR